MSELVEVEWVNWLREEVKAEGEAVANWLR